MDELPMAAGPAPCLRPEMREMVRFGLGVTGFTVMDTLRESADRFALGYVYGAGPLGYFQNASFLQNMLNLLTEPLHNVAVSRFSKLRDNLAELKRSWSAALSTVSIRFSAPPLRASL